MIISFHLVMSTTLDKKVSFKEYSLDHGPKIIERTKKRKQKELVRQSQIVQSVMYSYDAVISSYIIPAIHSWFGRSASEKVVFYVDFCSF